ncbi:MAG: hypothetical protein PHE61_04895 [Candidatus Omnitrophica bacterium]|nr:hypothetical protein [Candidatus Omnitrophota bacterium]
MEELSKRKRIGEILIEHGALTEEKLQKALEAQKREGGLIGEILIRMGFVREEDVVVALAAQFGCPYLPIQNFKVNPFAVKCIPAEIALKHCLIPVDKVHNVLTIVMADPTNERAKEEAAKVSDCHIQVYVSMATEIQKAIYREYRLSPGGASQNKKEG